MNTYRKALSAALAVLLLVMGLVVFDSVKGSNASSASASDIVSTAHAQVGKPYRWGGNGPSSFDCSGLVSYVLRQHGITPPRVSSGQEAWVTQVSRANLKPGDLVFYSFSGRNGWGKADHVALYVGNGETVDASSSKRKVVKRPILSGNVTGYGRVPGVNHSTGSSVSTPTATTNVSSDWADGTTRAEAARIVADTLELKDAPNKFGVKTEAGAVGALNEAGIAYPYEDGKFRPNTPITQAQVVLWLDRADVTRAQAARIVADILDLEDKRNPFGIYSEAGHGGAVGALNAEGIAYPFEDGLFRPHAEIERRHITLWMERVNR